jgi:hypothetical protein
VKPLFVYEVRWYTPEEAPPLGPDVREVPAEEEAKRVLRRGADSVTPDYWRGWFDTYGPTAERVRSP